MKMTSAIMTLLNTTALADGKVSAAEKALIFKVMKEQFACSDEELQHGFEKNMTQLQADATGMIRKSVLAMRDECSAHQLKKIIKLLKDLTMVDKNLDRREMMIIELLERLTEGVS
jgi:uncharacterized tellurite resistance protein B-like protein